MKHWRLGRGHHLCRYLVLHPVDNRAIRPDQPVFEIRSSEVECARGCSVREVLELGGLRCSRTGSAYLEFAVYALKYGPMGTGAAEVAYPLHQGVVRLDHVEIVRAGDGHGDAEGGQASVWLMQVSMRVAVFDVDVVGDWTPELWL